MNTQTPMVPYVGEYFDPAMQGFYVQMNPAVYQPMDAVPSIPQPYTNIPAQYNQTNVQVPVCYMPCYWDAMRGQYVMQGPAMPPVYSVPRQKPQNPAVYSATPDCTNITQNTETSLKPSKQDDQVSHNSASVPPKNETTRASSKKAVTFRPLYDFSYNSSSFEIPSDPLCASTPLPRQGHPSESNNGATRRSTPYGRSAHGNPADETTLTVISENDVTCTEARGDVQPQLNYSSPAIGSNRRSSFSGMRSAYKTRLCSAYLERKNCPHGTNCRFAHGTEEIRTLPALPRGPENPRYKTKLCKNYYKGASRVCPYGDRCEFIHPEDASQKDEGSEGAINSTQNSCGSHRSGFNQESTEKTGFCNRVKRRPFGSQSRLDYPDSMGDAVDSGTVKATDFSGANKHSTMRGMPSKRWGSTYGGSDFSLASKGKPIPKQCGLEPQMAKLSTQGTFYKASQHRRSMGNLTDEARSFPPSGYNDMGSRGYSQHGKYGQTRSKSQFNMNYVGCDYQSYGGDKGYNTGFRRSKF